MMRLRRVILASAGLLLAVAARPELAAADEPPGAHVTVGDNKGDTNFGGSVSTDPGGVTVQVSGTQSVPGNSSPPSNAPGGSTPGSPGAPGEPPAGGDPGPPAAPQNLPPPPDVPIPFNAGPLGGTIPYPGPVPGPTPPGPPTGTTPPSTGPGTTTSPRDIAVEERARVPLPSFAIRANPSLALVNLPVWFWTDGYDGRSFGTSRSVSLPPEVGPEVPPSVVPANDPRRQASTFTVEVRLWPGRCEWSFGDGKTLVGTSVGKPYPAESEVRHTYQYASTAFADGFPVSLTVQYAVEYRVNGGAPQALAPISQTYQARLRVQEAQAILTQR
jgi:hypothetical protein